MQPLDKKLQFIIQVSKFDTWKEKNKCMYLLTSTIQIVYIPWTDFEEPVCLWLSLMALNLKYESSLISQKSLEEEPNKEISDVGYARSWFICLWWSLKILNLKSSLWVPDKGTASGMIDVPSSMLTTSDMVGLSEGEALVHMRATLIILSASTSLNSNPNFWSTNSISFPLCCKWKAWTINN